MRNPLGKFQKNMAFKNKRNTQELSLDMAHKRNQIKIPEKH